MRTVIGKPHALRKGDRQSVREEKMVVIFLACRGGDCFYLIVFAVQAGQPEKATDSPGRRPIRQFHQRTRVRFSSTQKKGTGRRVSMQICNSSAGEDFEPASANDATVNVEEPLMPLFKPRFVRRANANGTTDSICCKCFMTVATARKELELDWPEGSHVCDPVLLKHWSELAAGKRRDDFIRGQHYSFC